MIKFEIDSSTGRLQICRDDRKSKKGNLCDFWSSNTSSPCLGPERIARLADEISNLEIDGFLLPDIVDSKDRVRGIRLLRMAALAHNCDSDVKGAYVFKTAGAWIEYLLSSSQHPDVLFRSIRYDQAFYSQSSDKRSFLQPLPRGDWAEEWRKGECLKWLKKPELLTIPELELALALFKWKSETPEFADWVTQYHRSLLPRIHRYFLQHYSFGLLKNFNRALNAAKLNSPAHRAGELAGIPLRMQSSIVIGAFALMGAGPLFPSVAQPENVPQGLLSLSVLLLAWPLWLLCRWEIFRHNHGFLERCEQANPRIWWLGCMVALSSVWVSAVLQCLLLLHKVTSSEWLNISDLYSLWPVRGMLLRSLFADWDVWVSVFVWFSGVFSLAVVAALVGMLIQWIWDEHSGLEP